MQKMLAAFDIKYCVHFDMKLYSDGIFYDWDNSIELKNMLFPVIIIDC